MSRRTLLFFIVLAIGWMDLHANANTLHPDSLLAHLQRNETEAVDSIIKALDNTLNRKKLPLHYALYLSITQPSHSVKTAADCIANWLEWEIMKEPELKKWLQYQFALTNLLPNNKSAFQIGHYAGFNIAKRHNYFNEAYSFMTQLRTYFQMFGDQENFIAAHHEMEILAEKSAYNQARYFIHKGYRMLSMQNDSGLNLVKKGIDSMTVFLGKRNDFLLADRFQFISDSINTASAHSETANYLISKGQLKLAGELLIKGLKLIPSDTIYNLRTIQFISHISSVYADLYNPDKALEYALEAKKIAESKGYSKIRNTTLAATLGKAYIAANHYDDAFMEFQLLLKAYEKNAKGLKGALLNMAQLYLKKGDYDQMADYLAWSDTIATSTKSLTMQSLLMKGYLDCHDKKYGLAIQKGEEALMLAEETNNLRMSHDAYHLLSLANERMGNGITALNYFKKYHFAGDTLYKQGQEMAFFDMMNQFHIEKKESEIASLEEYAVMKDKTIKTQNLLLAGLILLAIVLSALFYKLRLLNNQLKSQNTTITKAIDEKNILLKEIHHRVKNNLQVISSLLKLQSVYIQDDSAIQAITSGRNRVQAMAILHKNLYSDDDLTGVNMKTYFESLVQGLFDTYNINPEKITLTKNIEPIMLDVDTVIPLGLIANELISNSLKHAFNNRDIGHVDVSFIESNGYITLKIEDDGHGYNNQQINPGFGSKLIQTLGEKLNATIKIDNKEGCVVTIQIREYQSVI